MMRRLLCADVGVKTIVETPIEGETLSDSTAVVSIAYKYAVSGMSFPITICQLAFQYHPPSHMPRGPYLSRRHSHQYCDQLHIHKTAWLEFRPASDLSGKQIALRNCHGPICDGNS
jgi:hypothetical protein